jgi:uncharacterized metal-binding protein
MFCLAGIGGQLSGFVQSARDVSRMVVIDGCSLGCAKASQEKAQVPLKSYVILTDLGIEKNKDFDLKQEEIRAGCTGLAWAIRRLRTDARSAQSAMTAACFDL